MGPILSKSPEIIENLPQGMQVDVAYDSSVFIQESINNVYDTIVEAVVLVILIIFLFLRSLRATLVPLVTIPVSLIGAFFMMYLLGFTINTLTLLSLVLAIGLVVDDAIVMLENIFRHIEAGMSPMRAAFKGSREIAFAVIAMTITLAAVSGADRQASRSTTATGRWTHNWHVESVALCDELLRTWVAGSEGKKFYFSPLIY